MMKRSTGLRLYGVQDCPTVSMTATATGGDIEEVVKVFTTKLPILARVCQNKAGQIRMGQGWVRTCW